MLSLSIFYVLGSLDEFPPYFISGLLFHLVLLAPTCDLSPLILSFFPVPFLYLTCIHSQHYNSLQSSTALHFLFLTKSWSGNVRSLLTNPLMPLYPLSNE